MSTIYPLMNKQLQSLIEGETNIISVLSNVSALLNEKLDRINCVGFYLYNTECNELQLGPFQGKVACMHIPMNRGVCGTAAFHKKTLRIPNVHEFEGHIACDSTSNSEIVIPIIVEDSIYGVLDIDAPIFARFSEQDQAGLEDTVRIIEDHISKIF